MMILLQNFEWLSKRIYLVKENTSWKKLVHNMLEQIVESTMLQVTVLKRELCALT